MDKPTFKITPGSVHIVFGDYLTIKDDGKGSLMNGNVTVGYVDYRSALIHFINPKQDLEKSDETQQ